MTSASRLLLVLLLPFVALACDSDGGAALEEIADISAGGEDSDSADSAEDTPSTSDVEEEDPSFVLGVNITGQSIPGSFSELPEGDELLVEYGPQGLWMVVLAFKTKDLFDGLLLIKAAVESEGMLQGEFTMTGQEIIPGPGGYGYFYNFFLVVSDPEVAGSPGVVSFSVTDTAGVTHEVVREVQLVGGLETLNDTQGN
jgi:hypothetical protein